MMGKIIVLNGPAGVGKTTVGRLLAATVQNGVCIHVDALREFIVTHQPDQVEGGLGYKNAATLCTNFLMGGYELVVVDFVFEHPRHIQRFVNWAPKEAPIYLFTLWAPLELIVEREHNRSHRTPLGDRVLKCYQTMQNNLPELGYVVLNEEVTPEEVARQIKLLADEGKGLIERKARDGD